MKKILFFQFLFFASAVGQLTPLQKCNYTKITSHDELSQFLEVADHNSDLVTKEVIAESVEGRKLYAVYLSKDGFGKDETKLKILIFAQQHGNEHSGKEGALLLINEMLRSENQYLLDKIDLAIVPQMNPDGSEKNQRRNGNAMDLNRNHLILTEPETAGLHKLFNKYLFDVTLDVHEYFPYGETWKIYGYRTDNEVEIGTVTNINISQNITELSREYLNFIIDYLKDKEISCFEYLPGGPPEVNYIRRSTFDINDGRQSLGIQNSFSFIQEGKNGIDSLDNIKRRSETQMAGMMGMLVYSYRHKDEIKNLIADQREKLVKGEISPNISIQLDHFSDGSKLELPLLSYYSDSDTIITVTDYRPVVKSLYDVERPIGYLVPKVINEVIDWAGKHSLVYYDFKNSNEYKIEQYHIIRIDSMDFEGDIVVNPITELKEITNQLSENDYIFVPANQLKNNMIVIALEPKSELGLVTYRNYANLLKEGENYSILRVVKNLK